MNTRYHLAALAVVAGMLLAGCVPLPGAADNPLTDTSWVLTGLGNQTALSGAQVTLEFAGDRLSGNDGCNSYGTPYTLSGGKLTIDQNVVTTLMACEELVMQQASAYLAALVQAVSYTLDGQQLTLSDASGKALATFAKQSTDLTGTSWTVTGYNNGQQAVVSVIAGSELTVDFGPANTLSGSAGCNRYTGTYQVTGKTIKVGPLGSTRMACADPAGVMVQENAFLQALETATAWQLGGDRLELRTANGALAATLSRAK